MQLQTTLKINSRRELDLARILRAGDDAEIGRAESSPWRLEIRPVEDIERFGADLKSGVFGELEFALQRQVGAEVTRPAQVRQRSRRIAEGIWPRLGEGQRVEELTDAVRLGAGRSVHGAHDVRAQAVERQSLQRSVGRADRNRKPALRLGEDRKSTRLNSSH